MRTRLIAAAAAVLIGVLVAGAYVLGSNGDGSSGSGGVAALPAVSSKPIKPRAGHTRAAQIFANASPAVVSIRTGTGSGTGFRVDDARTIVTNAHVGESASQVTVRFGSDGRDITGRVTGTDPSSDLAVVRLPGGSAPSSAKPLSLADSRDVQVGDFVVAIGNPFGLDRTLTEGIVSGLGRAIQAPNGFEIDEAIQTDAAINPGNSGGPLLDDGGRVIGVNSQIETSGGSNGNVGIGFAVPSNTVRQVVPLLRAGRRVAHAWLGIQAASSNLAGGVQIADVTAGGPADEAGLQPGDVVTAIDGRRVGDFSDVSSAVNQKAPGDRLSLTIRRGGSEHSVDVRLGNRPTRVP
jgi:putative serine protease PepD